MDAPLLEHVPTIGRCVYRRACERKCLCFQPGQEDSLVCQTCGHRAGFHVHSWPDRPYQRPEPRGPSEALSYAIEDAWIFIKRKLT